MRSSTQQAKERWEASFEEQIARQANNTAPVEAIVRNVSYYLRDRYAVEDFENLHFLEMGCGTGPNLVWLAHRGIKISGIDISPTALDLAHRNLERGGYAARIDRLVEASVTNAPFGNESFDGIVEACVFQHLTKHDRELAFQEVRRLLKPGGVFAGYMLDVGHTLFQERSQQQLADDPGTLTLADGSSKIHLKDLGISHFYRGEEIVALLEGFSTVDPCLTTYHLPHEEATRRGYDEYLQSMWAVYAVK